MKPPDRLQRLYQATIANALSAHYAHALRNTLGGISVSMFFVRQRLESGDVIRTDQRIRKSLELIETSVREAATVADPRIVLPSSATTQLLLSDVVNELLATLSLPDGVRMLGPGACPLTAVASREELELAVYCLVENAIDAVESKGGGTVQIRLAGSAGACHLEIQDDGAGFAPGVLERVGHPFFSTRRGHLGMGLAVARRLISLLGGQLDLREAAPGGVKAAVAIVAPKGS